MLENLYTTKMSSSKKMLQRRFTKIRSKSGRLAKMMSLVMTLVLALALGTATIVMATVDGLEINNGTISVNGRKQAIDIKHIENSRYLHTDSYFVPLRKTFEMLDCRVHYNVPKSNVPDYMQGSESFPLYAWEGRKNLVTDFVTQQIYGATTGANTNMPIIEIASENGEKWYCQIGSEQYTNAWAPPVILIDNTAYISIRAIAYYLIPENENSDYSVLWDEVAHDTYYLGRMTFDEKALTLTINTDAKAGNSPHVDILKTILTNDVFKVVQRMESRNYMVCMIENYSRANTQTCVSIDKATGKTAQLDTFPSDTAFRLRLSFTDENHLTLKQIVAGSDELQEIKQYDLSNQQYNNIAPMEIIEWNTSSQSDNAEHMSYDDIISLQNQVDSGHYPWRLDPQQVIREFFAGEIGQGNGKITAFAGDGVKCSATYAVDGTAYIVELFKPIQKDEHSIWIVKKYNTD